MFIKPLIVSLSFDIDLDAKDCSSSIPHRQSGLEHSSRLCAQFGLKIAAMGLPAAALGTYIQDSGGPRQG